MTYKVNVYINEVYVTTLYDVPGGDEGEAQENALDHLAIDFEVEEQ